MSLSVEVVDEEDFFLDFDFFFELDEDFFLEEDDDFDFFDDEEELEADSTVEDELVLIGFCCLIKKMMKKTTRAATATPRTVL